MAGLILLATPLHAGPRAFWLPSFRVNPGGILEVPLSLDDATGLAAIRVRINFDPEVLDLQGVTSGPLGDAFELSHGDGEGFVQLVFARAEALTSGSGRLAMLRFQANSGAGEDLYSELAIAELTLSDESGVVDVRQKDILGTSNGQVIVTNQPDIDNSGNGLPDWWELQHDLDTFAPAIGTDQDGDTLDNFLEYAFGGDPNVPDAAQAAPFHGIQDSDGHPHLTLTFRRRTPPAPLDYFLNEGNDLQAWTTIDPDERLTAPPVDLGNGLERVTVRSQHPLDAPDLPDPEFIRIEVAPVAAP
jgi:hypothetical protein